MFSDTLDTVECKYISKNELLHIANNEFRHVTDNELFHLLGRRVVIVLAAYCFERLDWGSTCSPFLLRIKAAGSGLTTLRRFAMICVRFSSSMIDGLHIQSSAANV